GDSGEEREPFVRQWPGPSLDQQQRAASGREDRPGPGRDEPEPVRPTQWRRPAASAQSPDSMSVLTSSGGVADHPPSFLTNEPSYSNWQARTPGLGLTTNVYAARAGLMRKASAQAYQPSSCASIGLVAIPAHALSLNQPTSLPDSDRIIRSSASFATAGVNSRSCDPGGDGTAGLEHVARTIDAAQRIAEQKRPSSDMSH